MQRQQTKRVLATVLFTDIVGSTMVAEELGDQRWRELLSRHHQIARRELKNFGGRELDTAGDGLFASFDQPASAVRCAAAMVRAMQTLGIDIRAGVHVGECEQIGNKLGGIAVHTGSRVMSLGNAAEVLVSGTTHDLVAGSRISSTDRGMHELKGIEGEHRIWQVTSVDEAEVPTPLSTTEAIERRSLLTSPALMQKRWPRLALIGAALGVIGLLVYFIVLPEDNGISSIPPDSVGVIDPDAASIKSVFPVGSGPGAVVATGDKAWVARRDAGVVVVLDRTSGTVDTIAVGGSPTAMSLDQGRVWILSAASGELVSISADDDEVIGKTVE
ncbi:MAG: hypothetical protein QOH90_818, partial [Actinomycetota bacterium]|nr:hypothetical protein [Actinomycetota bacterium]